MKLLAIDGNSILNRAFYGIKLLSNKKGQFTNAIFGFMNINFGRYLLYKKGFFNTLINLMYAFIALIVLFIAEYCVEYKKVVVNDKSFFRVYVLCGIGLLTAILSMGVFNGGQFIYFQF